MKAILEKQKQSSSQWFKELRNQMVGSIEKIDGSNFKEKQRHIIGPLCPIGPIETFVDELRIVVLPFEPHFSNVSICETSFLRCSNV